MNTIWAATAAAAIARGLDPLLAEPTRSWRMIGDPIVRGGTRLFARPAAAPRTSEPTTRVHCGADD